jgi:hypothetical protein
MRHVSTAYISPSRTHVCYLCLSSTELTARHNNSQSDNCDDAHELHREDTRVILGGVDKCHQTRSQHARWALDECMQCERSWSRRDSDYRVLAHRSLDLDMTAANVTPLSWAINAKGRFRDP